MKLTYYRPGQPSKKSPFEKTPSKRRRRWLSSALNILILVATSSLLIYCLIVRAEPEVLTDSQTYHQSSDYRDALSAKLKDFKNRNKLTFDQSGIIAALKGQFPEISRAEIHLPVFSQRPVLKLTISEPSFVLKSQSGDYVIDKAGVAVGKVDDLPQITKLPAVLDQTGYDLRSGQQILSTSEVGFIITLITQTKNAKVPIAEMTLPPQAQELVLKTADRSYLIKFYLGGDALIQAGQFLAARHSFDQKNSQPKQYLDVRVAGKIYYK